MSRWKIKRSRSLGWKKRERSERKEEQVPQMITVGLPGSGLSGSVVPISPADSPHLARYLKAHKLLPFMYRFDPHKRKYQRYLEKSLRVLTDADATTLDLTRAIVVLGHSPCERAIAALERLSQTDHTMSGLARMALQECLMWMANDSSGMLPVAGVN